MVIRKRRRRRRRRAAPFTEAEDFFGSGLYHIYLRKQDGKRVVGMYYNPFCKQRTSNGHKCGPLQHDLSCEIEVRLLYPFHCHLPKSIDMEMGQQHSLSLRTAFCCRGYGIRYKVIVKRGLKTNCRIFVLKDLSMNRWPQQAKVWAYAPNLSYTYRLWIHPLPAQITTPTTPP